MFSVRVATHLLKYNPGCVPIANQKYMSSKLRYDLKDRVVLITGAGSGIGKETAELLLKEGVKGVTLADFNVKDGCKVAAELGECYGAEKINFVKCDVLCDDQIENAFESTVDKFKQLDIVFNNAGIFDECNFKRMIGINVTAVLIGTFLAVEKYLPKYRSCKEGVVINTASILGHTSVAYGPAYCATKHAVVGITKCFAWPSEYKKTSCRVMNLCPGFTSTNLWAKNTFLLRPQHKEEADEAIAKIEHQKPDVVAKTVIHMIKCGAPGSNWIINKGKMEEAKMKEAFDINSVYKDSKDGKNKC